MNRKSFHSQVLRHFQGRLSISLLNVMPAYADSYKWVDEQGNIHYGDKPSDELKGIKVELEPLNTTSQAEQNEALEKLHERANMADKRTKERASQKSFEALQASEQTLNNLQRCFDAYKVLNVLRAQVPIFIDDQGHYKPRSMFTSPKAFRRYIDDSERDRVIAQNQQIAADNCLKGQEQQAKSSVRLSSEP